ncbi:unnamed protein product [Ectocarpus sp. CCAP 1310/34]|nr:unnamed protein product [Ectocarpus sp. CCAP 1310/34]
MTWIDSGPGAEAREKLTLQEKLAYAGIRTPDLISRRFRGINLLQSLSLGDATTLTVRDDQAVYTTCGLPSPAQTSAIFDVLLNQSFSVGYTTLMSLVDRYQFSLVQVIPPLVEGIISCGDEKMGVHRVGEVLSTLADVECCLSDGGSERITVGAMMGNCLPCLDEQQGAARTSYFDPDISEKKTMAYTASEFGKENCKLGFSIKYKVHSPQSNSQRLGS